MYLFTKQECYVWKTPGISSQSFFFWWCFLFGFLTQGKTERPKKATDSLGTHSLVDSNQNTTSCPSQIWYCTKTSGLHKGSFSLFWQLKTDTEGCSNHKSIFQKSLLMFWPVFYIFEFSFQMNSLKQSGAQLKKILTWSERYFLRNLTVQGRNQTWGLNTKQMQLLVRGYLCAAKPIPEAQQEADRSWGCCVGIFLSHLTPWWLDHVSDLNLVQKHLELFLTFSSCLYH